MQPFLQRFFARNVKKITKPLHISKILCTFAGDFEYTFEV